MKKQRNEFTFLKTIIIAIILIVVFLGVYSNLTEKETKIIEDEPKEVILWPENKKDSRIGNYFLTEIEIIDGYYYAVIDRCLREDKEADYPAYIWGTWSQLDYPDFDPEIALVRYRLFPEDNDKFQPNKACYIKEIKTDEDWQEVKNKYNFSKDRFIQ